MVTKNTTYIFILLMLIIVSSCAQPENVDACVNAIESRGFLFGFIHGFIAPISFIATLFMDDVAVYAVNNSGGWYDFGFLLGIGGFSGGIFGGTRRRR